MRGCGIGRGVDPEVTVVVGSAERVTPQFSVASTDAAEGVCWRVDSGWRRRVLSLFIFASLSQGDLFSHAGALSRVWRNYPLAASFGRVAVDSARKVVGVRSLRPVSLVLVRLFEKRMGTWHWVSWVEKSA